MKEIIENSLKTAKSYEAYKSMVLELLQQGKATGPVQNENLRTHADRAGGRPRNPGGAERTRGACHGAMALPSTP